MTDLNATWNENVRGPRMSEATGRVIFKYQMPVKEEFTMELPAGAEIIRVEDMDGYFWLWAVIDTDAPMEKRYFRAFKTGAKMPHEVALKYIGFCAVFVQMELGLYIFEDIDAYVSNSLNKSVVFGEEEKTNQLVVNTMAPLYEEKENINIPFDFTHNISKSDMVKYAAEINNIDVVDVKMSDCNPADLIGNPKYQLEMAAGIKDELIDDEKWHLIEAINKIIADIKGEMGLTATKHINQTQLDVFESQAEDEDDG